MVKQELSLNTTAPQRIPKRNGNRLTFWCFCVITHNTNAHLPPTPLSKYSGRGKVNNHHHTKQYRKNVKQSEVRFSSFMPIIFVTAELTEESLAKGREAERVLPSGPAHSASWVSADLGKKPSSWEGTASGGWASGGWGHNLTPAHTKTLKWRTLPWPGASLPGGAPFVLARQGSRGSCSKSSLSELHPVGKPSLRITLSLNYWLQSKQQQETFL